MSKFSAILHLIQKDNFKLGLIIIFIISTTALSFAYFVEYVLNHKPCILCIYQRVPYFLILVISLIALYFKKIIKISFVSINLLLCAEIGLAIYHVLIEHHILSETSKCALNNKLDQLSIDDLKIAIMNESVSSCSNGLYLINYISMTEMNLIFAIMFLILTIRIQRVKL